MTTTVHMHNINYTVNITIGLLFFINMIKLTCSESLKYHNKQMTINVLEILLPKIVYNLVFEVEILIFFYWSLKFKIRNIKSLK